MTIQMDETLRGMWFVHWEGGDWLAAVSRRPQGIFGDYRFRYHRDNLDPFISKDEKSWWKIGPVEGPSAEADLIRAMSEMAKHTERFMGGKRYELLRGEGTHEQFVAELVKLPFVHRREMAHNHLSSDFDQNSEAIISDHVFEGTLVHLKCTHAGCGLPRSSHLLNRMMSKSKTKRRHGRK